MVDVTSLPEPVRDYIERVLPSPVATVQRVRIEQTGEMILKRGARPLTFTPTQELATDRVAFAWHARFRMLGPVALRVTDSYDGREGRLEVRAFGLPLQRNRGPELAQSEAIRYLAEFAWAPPAILSNPQLQWRQLDERTVELATPVAGERIAVQLTFSETGEISQASAQRPRLESGNAPTPWIGDYADSRELGGVRVPTRAEVRWKLPDGPLTYWRGTVTSLRLCD